MKTTFTPGPWRVIDHDEDHISITDVNQEYCVARIELKSLGSRELMKVNAHLIAAAPEMLDALQLLINDDRVMNALNPMQARAILDAVSKLTGGAQ